MSPKKKTMAKPKPKAKQIATSEQLAAEAERAAAARRLAEEREAVTQVFNAADASKDGFLYLEDLKTILEKIGLGDADRLLKEMDTNHDNKVDLNEFIAWIFSDDGEIARVGVDNERKLKEIFKNVWDIMKGNVEDLRQNVDSILQQAETTFENAALALCIEKCTLAEMRVFGRPPPEVHKVVEALACLLRGTSQPMDWPACQEFLKNQAQVVDGIAAWQRDVQQEACNVSSIGLAAAERLLQPLCPEMLRSKSNGASMICAWIQGMIEYHRLREEARLLNWAIQRPRA